VKRFARRKPGVFILAAAVTGVVVGRLTRALASNASDEKDAAPAPVAPPRQVHPDPSVPVPVGSATDGTAGTPLYTRTASTRPEILGEDGNDRSNTV
jgi:hypothetical protein